jgi:hypothetical protein
VCRRRGNGRDIGIWSGSDNPEQFSFSTQQRTVEKNLEVMESSVPGVRLLVSQFCAPSRPRTFAGGLGKGLDGTWGSHLQRQPTALANQRAGTQMQGCQLWLLAAFAA